MSKVYQLLDKFRFGGGENVAFNYARILNKLNIENYLIAKNQDNNFINKLKNYKINYKTKLNKINKNDVLIIHTNRNLIKIFIKYFFKINKPKIYYLQHLEYDEKKFKRLSKIINYICNGFIQITPITENLINKYIKIPVIFFQNFNINRYKKEEYEKIKNKIRKELNLKDDDYIAMFSGTFKKGKNLSHILYFAEKNPKIKFLILGDGEERSILKNKTNNIIWLGRVEDVEKYLIASDLYLFTSGKEMMPMALIEAINYNKACLAYNIEVNKYLLNKIQLCKNKEEMNQKIKELYKNKINYFEYKTKYNFDYGIRKMKELLNI
ncbi:hypothetical protein OSSY52_03210 [Tepiditoga spiralis]|uniref:Glycosyl transferase family 1 domain-containing protein n=1 Tax=Tepiditoga spiralis TaxID=2108365 RepID=A0A7G1G1R8_9BACT|nr:glycosyltransferase [Tepiditoga spiralis]BBE30180.1 hypothetical protein OSSY52_03210 [Tepiditoga spiralis]